MVRLHSPLAHASESPKAVKPAEQFRTLAWIAQETGIPVQTLYRQVKERKLAHIRMGKRIRVADSALAVWLESLQVSAA